MTRAPLPVDLSANGAAWAAILSAGIGCAALGLFIDLGEGTKLFGRILNLYDPVGNLSGKTIAGVSVWLIAWALLHWKWKGREIHRSGRIVAATLLLVAIGILASFPPVFELLAG
jgi:uncharacterized membrane protein YidH (DUF202 family)